MTSPKDIKAKRSRIVALEAHKNHWPARYHNPGRPKRVQMEYFERMTRAFMTWHTAPFLSDAGSIVLEGPTGCGKTHLAAVLSLMAATQCGMSSLYLSCQTMASAMSGPYGQRNVEPGDVMAQVAEADIVFLDDLGTQNGLAKSIIPEIIERCTADMKLLVSTTNNSADELINQIGERGVSRIKGGAWIQIPLDVQDFRTDG